MIVGLVGKAQNGKTTVANHLITQHNFMRVSFGDLLKETIINSGLCTHEECYEKKTDRSRELMQKIGTEIIREQVDMHFWVKAMRAKIKGLRAKIKQFPNRDIVIDDVRFHNESHLILELDGVLVRVKRTGFAIDNQEAQKHRSETEQDTIGVHAYIEAKSGDINLLCDQIDAVYRLYSGKGAE